MRRIAESEIETDFEKQFCWGDDERYLYHPNRRKASVFGHFLRIDEVLKLVEKLSSGPRVADFACAQGNFGLLLAERGYDVTAVDIHPEFLKYAKKKHTHGKFKTVQANIIEFRGAEKFDCILAGEVIEHVAFPDQLLESIASNLKPGGICVLTTPNGSDFSSKLPTYRQVTDIESLIPKQFHWGDHLFLYTTDELKELFSNAGLEMVFIEKYHSSYISQMKGIRYLFPLSVLKVFEKWTRHWKKDGKDSANLLIAVGRKKKETE